MRSSYRQDPRKKNGEELYEFYCQVFNQFTDKLYTHYKSDQGMSEAQIQCFRDRMIQIFKLGPSHFFEKHLQTRESLAKYNPRYGENDNKKFKEYLKRKNQLQIQQLQKQQQQSQITSNFSKQTLSKEYLNGPPSKKQKSDKSQKDQEVSVSLTPAADSQDDFENDDKLFEDGQNAQSKDGDVRKIVLLPHVRQQIQKECSERLQKNKLSKLEQQRELNKSKIEAKIASLRSQSNLQSNEKHQSSSDNSSGEEQIQNFDEKINRSLNAIFVGTYRPFNFKRKAKEEKLFLELDNVFIRYPDFPYENYYTKGIVELDKKEKTQIRELKETVKKQQA